MTHYKPTANIASTAPRGKGMDGRVVLLELPCTLFMRPFLEHSRCRFDIEV